jgi:hypothetical protein
MAHRRYALLLALALALFPALRAAHAIEHATCAQSDEVSSVHAACALCVSLHGAALDESPLGPEVVELRSRPPLGARSDRARPSRTLARTSTRAPPLSR